MTFVARIMDDVTPTHSLESAITETSIATTESLTCQITAALRIRLGASRYDLWFDRKTSLQLQGNALVVAVANTFAANWIRSKFNEDLRAAALEVTNRDLEIAVRVDADLASTTAGPLFDADHTATDNAPAPRITNYTAAPTPASPVLKFALEDFVVGPSNQMVYHAALQVASNPGQQFNPLFIHGHCGLGKTHLLQGICARFAKNFPEKKWLYITGEQFTNDFLDAIKTHKTDAFRKRLRNADLLVIDDVHFLANKKATQEEFLHTFNQIDSLGKQIVLASDCAPKQIHALSEQLSSRFISGMVLRVDSPDVPTRLEILRRRVARNGWNVADSVLMHIAQSAAASVRELEGLLLQALAGIRLINSGAPEASSVLAALKDRTAARTPISVDRIITSVAAHFALAVDTLLGAGREKLPALARAVAMHLARQHTGMSFPEIGRAMGGKKHSTVIAACQRVEGLIASGDLVSWTATDGAHHQAIADILHGLELQLRRRA